MSNKTVVSIAEARGTGHKATRVEYDYHNYHVLITYRPRTNDFRWTITRQIILKQSDNAPTLDAAQRAAEKYINRISKKRKK